MDVPVGQGATLREVIGARVRAEVRQQGGGADRCAEEVQRALDAFGRNGFFVFAGQHQFTGLDEVLTPAEAADVSFVRLTPLAGG